MLVSMLAGIGFRVVLEERGAVLERAVRLVVCRGYGGSQLEGLPRGK